MNNQKFPLEMCVGVARIFEMALQSILRIDMPWTYGRKGQAHVRNMGQMQKHFLQA